MNDPTKYGLTVKSALVIIPPETLWKQIQNIRRSHDRAFQRWMPHINLLYPFISASNEEYAQEAQRICSHLATPTGSSQPLPSVNECPKTYVRKFMVGFTKESFGYFTHGGKTSTVWLKPLFAKHVQNSTKKNKFDFTSPDLVHFQNKKVVSQNTKIHELDQSKEKRTNSNRLQFNNKSDPNFEKVIAVVDSNKAEINTCTTAKTPNHDSVGIDCLRYAVWNSEVHSESLGNDVSRNNEEESRSNNNTHQPELVHVNSDHNNSMPSQNLEERKTYHKALNTKQHEEKDSDKSTQLQEETCSDNETTSPINTPDSDCLDDDFTRIVLSTRQKDEPTVTEGRVDDSVTVSDEISAEVIDLHDRLYQLYMKDRDGESVRPPYSPHLTLGRCPNKNVESFIDKLRSAWEPVWFTVDQIHIITRNQDKPFWIQETIGLLSS